MCCVMFKRSIDFDYYIIKDHNLLEVTEGRSWHYFKAIQTHSDIAKVASKATQWLGMSQRCFSKHSSDVIKPLYQAIVRSIIKYNSPVWNPWLLKVNDIQELDKVQKRCLKLC